MCGYMVEDKSIEELREMHPDAQHDYLFQKEIFTEPEWEVYKEVTTGEYRLREVVNKSFKSDNGSVYHISVEKFADGEASDEMNTRINIVDMDTD